MFGLDLTEYQEPGVRLADYLPWALLAGRGVVQNKTGALMRVLRYRGHPSSSRLPAEQVAAHAQFNRALQSLGAGWALHCEAQRVPCDEYVRPARGPALARTIDGIREHNFIESGALFETRFYLTLTWTPERARGARLLERMLGLFGGLFEGGHQVADEQRQRAEALEHFLSTTRQFLDRCGPLFRQARWLGDDEVLTYLHSTISTKRHRITTPSVPMYLDAVLADEAVELGLEGRVGEHHLRVISVKGYPNRTHPDFLRALQTCPFPLRFVTRFLALGHERAQRELAKYENLFFSQQDRLASSLFGHSGGPKNQAALEASAQVGQVKKRLDQGHIAAGYHSASVVVWDRDYEVCRTHAEHLLGILRQLGFACTDEGPNLKAAWLGTHPGNVWANPRRALVSSKNLAHLMPTTAVWTGRARSTHIGRAPHIYAFGQDGAPFRLHLNVGDVGHTMVLGPTGAGKSVLLGMLQMQWLKYPNAQVFVFDKGRSARAATLAVGGQFLELDVDSGELAFQPFRHVDRPGEAAWAVQWCEEICALEGLEVDATRRAELRRVIHESMVTSPPHMRTMTTLYMGLQLPELAEVFAPFASGSDQPSPWAEIWDHDQERLRLSDWTTVEMAPLMDAAPRLIAMTLRYLFHRLEQRFEGRPTLLVLDEAWVFLSNPIFAERLSQWLRELRKRNVYVVFATQNLTDALDSEIAPTLLQNCATQILLPNPKALHPQVRQAYQKLGLSEGTITQLGHARPKREYLLWNAEGERLFELGLSELELAVVGASSPADHARIDRALEHARGSSRSFAHHYLRLSGFGTYADQMP